MTKEAYREELAAAHARIAQLEAQLAGMSASQHPKIDALERRRVEIVRTSDRNYLLKLTAGIVGGFTFVFAGIGVIAWASAGADPREAGLILGIGGMGLIVGLVIGVVQLFATPAAAQRQLAKIDRDLAEARRIARLESEVAAMRRVRVASEPTADGEEEEETKREEERR